MGMTRRIFDRIAKSIAQSGLLAAVLTGCGSADPVAAGVDAGMSRRDVGVDGRPTGASTVQLSSLPSNPTTATSAAITYTLVPASAADTVYCRLDAYAPTVCPSPFVLGGAKGALGVGAHEVDYYVDRGAGITAAAPDVSYSWSVVGGDAGSTADGESPVDGSPPGVTPLVLISASDSFSSMAGSVQLLGGEQPLASVSETTGITGSGAITGPMGPSTLRFGKIADPVTPSRSVFYFASKTSDGVTFNHLGRVEIVPAGFLDKSGTTYWIAQEMYVPAGRLIDGGAGALLSIHQPDSPNPATGPFELDVMDTSLFSPYGPGADVAFERNAVIGSTAQPDAGYPWASNVPAGSYGLTSQTAMDWPTDQWVTFVAEYRGDPVGTTGTLNCWLVVKGVTTQIVSRPNLQIGIATATALGGDYLKFGIGNLGSGSVNGVWELRRSGGIWIDAGYTVQQIIASMP